MKILGVENLELLLGRLNSTFKLAEESANLKMDGEKLQNLKHKWEKEWEKKKKKKPSSHYMHKSTQDGS